MAWAELAVEVGRSYLLAEPAFISSSPMSREVRSQRGLEILQVCDASPRYIEDHSEAIGISELFFS